MPAPVGCLVYCQLRALLDKEGNVVAMPQGTLEATMEGLAAEPLKSELHPGVAVWLELSEFYGPSKLTIQLRRSKLMSALGRRHLGTLRLSLGDIVSMQRSALKRAAAAGLRHGDAGAGSDPEPRWALPGMAPLNAARVPSPMSGAAAPRALVCTGAGASTSTAGPPPATASATSSSCGGAGSGECARAPAACSEGEGGGGRGTVDVATAPAYHTADWVATELPLAHENGLPTGQRASVVLWLVSAPPARAAVRERGSTAIGSGVLHTAAWLGCEPLMRRIRERWGGNAPLTRLHADDGTGVADLCAAAGTNGHAGLGFRNEVGRMHVYSDLASERIARGGQMRCLLHHAVIGGNEDIIAAIVNESLPRKAVITRVHAGQTRGQTTPAASDTGSSAKPGTPEHLSALIDCPDGEGVTPLAYACQYGRFKSVHILLALMLRSARLAAVRRHVSEAHMRRHSGIIVNPEAVERQVAADPANNVHVGSGHAPCAPSDGCPHGIGRPSRELQRRALGSPRSMRHRGTTIVDMDGDAGSDAGAALTGAGRGQGSSAAPLYVAIDGADEAQAEPLPIGHDGYLRRAEEALEALLAPATEATASDGEDMSAYDSVDSAGRAAPRGLLGLGVRERDAKSPGGAADPVAEAVRARVQSLLRQRTRGGDTPAHLAARQAAQTAVNVALMIMHSFGFDVDPVAEVRRKRPELSHVDAALACARAARAAAKEAGAAAVAAATRHAIESATTLRLLARLGAPLACQNAQGETVIMALVRGIAAARTAASAAAPRGGAFTGVTSDAVFNAQLDPVAFGHRRGAQVGLGGYCLLSSCPVARRLDGAALTVADAHWHEASAVGGAHRTSRGDSDATTATTGGDSTSSRSSARAGMAAAAAAGETPTKGAQAALKHEVDLLPHASDDTGADAAAPVPHAALAAAVHAAVMPRVLMAVDGVLADTLAWLLAQHSPPTSPTPPGAADHVALDSAAAYDKALGLRTLTGIPVGASAAAVVEDATGATPLQVAAANKLDAVRCALRSNAAVLAAHRAALARPAGPSTAADADATAWTERKLADEMSEGGLDGAGRASRVDSVGDRTDSVVVSVDGGDIDTDREDEDAVADDDDYCYVDSDDEDGSPAGADATAAERTASGAPQMLAAAGGAGSDAGAHPGSDDGRKGDDGAGVGTPASADAGKSNVQVVLRALRAAAGGGLSFLRRAGLSTAGDASDSKRAHSPETERDSKGAEDRDDTGAKSPHTRRDRALDANEALDDARVLALREAVVAELSVTLALPRHVVEPLVETFEWDVDRLVLAYFDDPAATLRRTGHAPPPRALTPPPPETSEGCVEVGADEAGEPPADSPAAVRAESSAAGSVSTVIRRVDGLIAEASDAVLPTPETPVPDAAAAAVAAQDTASKRDADVDADADADADADGGREGEDPEEEVECKACMDDVRRKDLHALPCGHGFCHDCWAGHLKAMVKEHGRQAPVAATCLQSGCRAVVGESTWRAHADEATVAAFSKQLLASFVSKAGAGRACYKCGMCVTERRSGIAADALAAAGAAGHADPGHAAAAMAAGSEAECDHCGFRMCMSCGTEDHAPATCEQARAWSAALDKFTCAKSVAMIMGNFKACPGCGNFIEKSVGCKHMTCVKFGGASGGCGKQFCYNCGADWPGYSHSCAGGFSDARPKAPSAWNANVKVSEAAITPGGATGPTTDTASRRRFEVCAVTHTKHSRLHTELLARADEVDPPAVRPRDAARAPPAASVRGVEASARWLSATRRRRQALQMCKSVGLSTLDAYGIIGSNAQAHRDGADCSPTALLRASEVARRVDERPLREEEKAFDAVVRALRSLVRAHAVLRNSVAFIHALGNIGAAHLEELALPVLTPAGGAGSATVQGQARPGADATERLSHRLILHRLSVLEAMAERLGDALPPDMSRAALVAASDAAWEADAGVGSKRSRPVLAAASASAGVSGPDADGLTSASQALDRLSEACMREADLFAAMVCAQ